MNKKQILKKYWFIIAIILLAIIKQLLISNIPITPYPNQLCDDDMMVEMAKSIRAGKWLGNYTSNTLVKGPVFPIILAIINYFGFSYIGTMNLIYTIACIYFIYTIKDVLKSKKALIFLYLILLFNPVSYAWWTLQRVYRNGITLAQVLIIIGSLFAMYRRRDEKAKKMLPFSIIGGITLATLWLTREDGIWILPFTMAVIVLTIVLIIIKAKKEKINIKEIGAKVFIAILPLIILVVSLNTIRFINQKNYGVFVYNEINDGYFGKVIKTIYSVKTDEDIKYVTATRKKMNLLYENSKTLNSIKDEMEKALNLWDLSDRNPKDTQVEDGWFWWALKDAAENAGMYENAEKANEFYKKVYEEINQAIKEGKLEKQSTMPSNLMSPWKAEYFKELPEAMSEITKYVINYNDVQTVNYAVDIPDDQKGSTKFEAITNNLAVTKSKNNEIDNVSKYTEKYVKRVNTIGNIYKATGSIFAIFGIICYIVITIRMLKSKQKNGIIDMWLLLTGVACSLIVLIGGVSYNHITSCFSMYYMYLSGAYPLINIFFIGSISYAFQKNKEEAKIK